MIYSLLVWTVVGFAGNTTTTHEKYDWRLLVETQSYNHNGEHSAKEVCEMTAKELGLKKFRTTFKVESEMKDVFVEDMMGVLEDKVESRII